MTRSLDRGRVHRWMKLLGLVGLVACSRSNISVPRGPHRPAQEEPPIRVNRMPPPAEIEVVPLQRNEDCAYLDGHHEPAGGTWFWKAGAWVHPPAGCYYAPPITRYEKVKGGTTLVHRPGVWLPETRGSEVCGAPEPCREHE